jgi:holo-[acyl-carrier protein] synthase
MIAGMGVDLVEISRIERALERFGERFERRILHEEERVLLPKGRRRVEFVAGRFAAKEALSKALRTGIGSVSFQDIVIEAGGHGEPLVRLKGMAEQQGNRMGIRRWHVAITHTREHAMAVVIAET